jgi:hypothetical protein
MILIYESSINHKSTMNINMVFEHVILSKTWLLSKIYYTKAILIPIVDKVPRTYLTNWPLQDATEAEAITHIVLYSCQ